MIIYSYSLKDFQQMMLEQSNMKKRKCMNKKPHKNNYKQKIRIKRIKRGKRKRKHFIGVKKRGK